MAIIKKKARLRNNSDLEKKRIITSIDSGLHCPKCGAGCEHEFKSSGDLKLKELYEAWKCSECNCEFSFVFTLSEVIFDEQRFNREGEEL